MLDDVTGAGADCIGAGAGGGAVFTACSLCVQAPRTRAADRQANFRVLEKRIITKSPGSEARRCGRPLSLKNHYAPNVQRINRQKEPKNDIRNHAILGKHTYWIKGDQAGSDAEPGVRTRRSLRPVTSTDQICEPPRPSRPYISP